MCVCVCVYVYAARVWYLRWKWQLTGCWVSKFPYPLLFACLFCFCCLSPSLYLRLHIEIMCLQCVRTFVCVCMRSRHERLAFNLYSPKYSVNSEQRANPGPDNVIVHWYDLNSLHKLVIRWRYSNLYRTKKKKKRKQNKINLLLLMQKFSGFSSCMPFFLLLLLLLLSLFRLFLFSLLTVVRCV